MKNLAKRVKIKNVGAALLIFIFVFLTVLFCLQKQLLDNYEKGKSLILTDRFDQEIFIKPNKNDYLAVYSEKIPSHFQDLLLKKEDRYFYYHFGFNPWSIASAALGRLGIGARSASSTIPQQLAKILLGKELERSLKNKFIESFYTISLEIFQSKKDILKMYANSIYFGNQIQGVAEASRFYFGLPPELLSDGQITQLLATIHSPSENNPSRPQNQKNSLSLVENLKIGGNAIFTPASEVKQNMAKRIYSRTSYFEIQSLVGDFNQNKNLTVDDELTERIREILKRNIEELSSKNAKNGAVVVIKLPENELLSMIGSPDPSGSEDGYQINMAEKPRAIGSTIKPFIYLKAFEKGLRPYTLVQDQEYKYTTGLGFPLYPKNYDYQYRGEVNLHYSLSNSLNVPAVKVLEYVGLDDFYKLLEQDLGFQPIQDLDTYQLGIALGALEMSLFDLSKYFTIFPNNGVLKNLQIETSQNPQEPKKISDQRYIQLVNKILNDRMTGIDEFSSKSQLNLFQSNYALKTGTSRDYRDSWVLGYTPDFLVGVWVGNHDNSGTDELSGQKGAGIIWAEVMNLLLNSDYNKKTPLDFNEVRNFTKENSQNIEYGLEGDNYQKALKLLESSEQNLILLPHENDVFLLEENSEIILKATEKVKWYVGGKFLTENQEASFAPKNAGQYQIQAEAPNGASESVEISINQ